MNKKTYACSMHYIPVSDVNPLIIFFFRSHRHVELMHAEEL